MPQPIDFHSEVAKVDVAARVQEIVDRASLAAHQRGGETEERVRVESETQVQQADRGEGREVDAEAHRRNPFSGRRRRKPEKPEEEERRPPGSAGGASGCIGEGGRIDISI